MSIFQIDPLTTITQRCYRGTLAALSRPGDLQRVSDWTESALQELSFPRIPSPVAALAFTLLDEQVSLASCGTEADSWIREIAAATGCRIVPMEDADYLFCHSVPTISDLKAVRQGDLLSPEDGATVIVWLNAKIEGRSGTLHITGPGVESSVRFQVSSPMLSLIENRLAIDFEYPMGFDLLVFGSDERLLGIPRSSTTRILLEGDV